MSIKRPQTTSALGRAALQRIKAHLRDFRDDESGALFIFGMMMLILMLTIGGFAMNLMRYERVRVDLSQTLDRASLAAASLSQTLDPKAVVEDYMKKQGLGDYLEEVIVTSSVNSRVVKAKARAVVPFFMSDFFTVKSLPAIAGSGARQDVTDLEIILVLDISGSMDWVGKDGKKKIDTLKVAAKDFITNMLSGEAKNHVSIGIVPYNAQVNVGADLLSRFTTRADAFMGGIAYGRNDSNCVVLPDSQFNQAGLSRTVTMHKFARGDFSNYINHDSDWRTVTDINYRPSPSTTGQNPGPNWFCGHNSNSTISSRYSEIMMPTNDETKLKAKIDSLIASGNTSIALGMKWGAALIDPSARPLYTFMGTKGEVPAIFTDRPFDYSKSDSMKVIVLMTDGNHVVHQQVKANYEAGPSPIWKAADGNYMIDAQAVEAAAALSPTQFMDIYPASANVRNASGVLLSNSSIPVATNTVKKLGMKWWVPHLSTCITSTGCNNIAGWRATKYVVTGQPDTTTVQLDWEQVWAEKRLGWVLWQLYARPKGGIVEADRKTAFNNQLSRMLENWKTVPEMDALLQKTCNQVKTKTGSDYPVRVFGIAIYGTNESDTALGAAQIKQCSTNNEYFYEVGKSGKTIADAFAGIAATINNLRLTN